MEPDTSYTLPPKDMRAKAATMQRLASLGDASSSQAKIREAAQDFEAVFISQMLEHMFAGIETNEAFGGGHAEDIYKSMMIDEYGKIMAKSGGIGVADHVARQLLQTQEASSHQPQLTRDMRSLSLRSGD